jgi:hypothetical protein
VNRECRPPPSVTLSRSGLVSRSVAALGLFRGSFSSSSLRRSFISGDMCASSISSADTAPSFSVGKSGVRCSSGQFGSSYMIFSKAALELWFWGCVREKREKARLNAPPLPGGRRRMGTSR